jgi:ABC-type proline/glycine betaine transport system substrate-binding protein
VALTAQTANITSTAFTGGATAGLYRVNYCLQCTTADAAAGTVTLTVSWTDGAGATSVASAALALTAVGRTSGIFYVQLASGSITYATANAGGYGTAQYALYETLERLN